MSLRLRRVLGSALILLALGVWLAVLRPQALGGPALFVIVRGDSMLPIYANGDLLLVESGASYSVGDAVAYRVPAGELGAGHVVVHRLVDGDGTAGFVVQGDNNPAPDPWSPKAVDIAGRVSLAVPGVGQLIGCLVRPAIAGSLTAALVVTWLFARPRGWRKVPMEEAAQRIAVMRRGPRRGMRCTSLRSIKCRLS